MDNVKGRPVEGYDADDYVGLTVTATEQIYIIGTMAFANDPTTLVPMALHGITRENYPTYDQLDDAIFLAQEILVYATADTYIRFNESSRVLTLLLAGNFYRFRRKCYRLYYVRSAANGTLHVWATG